MAGEELDQFVAGILDEKKLPGITDEEVRQQLIDELKTELLNQINRALIDAMSDEKIDAFNTLLDNPDTTQEELQSFVMNSGVDVQRVTTQTMLYFRSLYLETPEERDAQ